MCLVQGILLAADRLSIGAGENVICQNGVDMPVCQNGTDHHSVNHNDDDDDGNPPSIVSRVRLVQFEKHTTDPLVIACMHTTRLGGFRFW